MPVAETSTITTIKYSWYWLAIIFFEFLSISWIQFYILSILMLIDLVTWIAKQYVLDSKLITSHRMWIGSIKQMITLLIIIALALSFIWLWLAVEYKERVLSALISLFIMNELYSIVWNWYTVRTWKAYTEYDAISLIFKKIWEVIVNIINSKLK